MRDEPCERCGWRYPGFHVCVDLSGPEPMLPPGKKAKKRQSVSIGRSASGLIRGTPEWREAIREGMSDHNSRIRENNRARDDVIISHYKEGLSIKQVANLMELNHQTVGRALLIAEKEGLVSIRRYARDEERDNLIIELYSDGGTMPGIAKDLGISPMAISRVLHRAQKDGLITIRRGRPRKKE